jgi:SAM-dependent methyltransferase
MGGPFVEYLRQYRNLYDVLFHKVKERLDRNHVALDVGCNVGGMVYRLAPHCAFVYGVDLSFAATLIARRLLLHQPVAQKSYRLPREGRQSEERGLALRRPGNVEMVVASGTHLPFPPGMFDLVSCLSVIDNVPDPAALIGSISDSLKPGGIFLFSSPYSWIVEFTNVNKWLGEETGQPPAMALRTLLTEQFEILWDQDAVPWILRDDQRCYEVWLNHCVLAQKKQP